MLCVSACGDRPETSVASGLDRFLINATKLHCYPAGAVGDRSVIQPLWLAYGGAVVGVEARPSPATCSRAPLEGNRPCRDFISQLPFSPPTIIDTGTMPRDALVVERGKIAEGP